MNRTYTKFLTQYPSKSTRATYNWALRKFFDSMYEDGSIESQIEHYLDAIEKKRKKLKKEKKKDTSILGIQQDLSSFFSSSAEAEMPPKSMGTIEGTLRAFFNYVEEYDGRIAKRISESYWKELKRRNTGLKSKRALTLDTIPTALQFRRIVSHLPIQGKALGLVLSSGGMRIGDALQIKLKNLRLNQTLEDGTQYHEIDIFDKKINSTRTVFITNEAVEAVEEWLNVRDDYLRTSRSRCHQQDHYKKEFKGKPLNNTRLFPFSTSNARVMWNRAIEKAGLDERDSKTNRRKIHPHSLRKFFRTKMGGAGVPIDIVEALLGHEGYLAEYQRYSKEDLVRFYLRGSSALNIYGDSGAVQSQLEAHRKAIRALAAIALKRAPSEVVREELQSQGINPDDYSVGGGKAIKTEWGLDEDTIEVLRILRELE